VFFFYNILYHLHMLNIVYIKLYFFFAAIYLIDIYLYIPVRTEFQINIFSLTSVYTYYMDTICSLLHQDG